MNINHERLVPGTITYWGDVVGDITDQKDLVDYVDSHGVTQESFNNHEAQNAADFNTVNDRLNTLEHDKLDSQLYTEHVISNIQSFVALDNRVTALEQGGGSGGGGVTPDEFNAHKAQNDASFKEAFDRIEALEQGGGGGGVSQQDFDAHAAQNAEDFQIVDGRLTALEQNPGVSQQTFAAHADQNNSQFQAFANDLQNINNQFQNYATRDYANQLYQSSIDITNQSVSGLSASIDELRNDLNNNTVTTQQCEEPGLTDYILTSLVWIGSPAILAMDDHYTGDNAENRDVTIWGSYMDENDNSRVKFGKVNTTYEQNPNTQEYIVTGQTFSEMMTLTRREGIEHPVVDRPNASVIPEDYSNAPYILSMSESNHNIGEKSVDYISCEADDIYKISRTYHEVNGEWELQKDVIYQPVWIGGEFGDVLWKRSPEVPNEYPMSAFYDLSYEDGIGVLDESTWEFNGYKMDENYNLGKYKIEGVEEDPENEPGVITYYETFIPYIAAEEPDTSTDGTYILKATVQDGQVTYSWVPENVN